MSTNFWNPWHGCHKCSPGCEHCYMYFLDKQREVSEKSAVVTRTQNFDMPLKKDRHGNYKVKAGQSLRVNMTSDTFVEEADAWRDEMWDIIRKRPDVKFWLLTKRPERMADHLPEDWGDGWDNVMLNVTCENQDMFDKRWPVFEKIPAKHKGMCLAPFISAMNIEPALKTGQLDEVSCGGENYDNPRPCRYEWVVSVAQQCWHYQTSFLWYETGTKLIKDGMMYTIPTKHEQARQAYLGNLSFVFPQRTWHLHSPVDGHELAEDELYQKQYNLYACAQCSNISMCSGCSNCGKCARVKLVNLKELETYKKECLSTKEAGESILYQNRQYREQQA